MTSFTEASTVELLVHDILCAGVVHHTATGADLARRNGKVSGLGWDFLSPDDVPRQACEVFAESWLRNALLLLNPELAAEPDRADKALYKLRAIVLSVRSDEFIKATRR